MSQMDFLKISTFGCISLCMTTIRTSVFTIESIDYKKKQTQILDHNKRKDNNLFTSEFS